MPHSHARAGTHQCRLIDVNGLCGGRFFFVVDKYATLAYARVTLTLAGLPVPTLTSVDYSIRGKEMAESP